MGCGAQTAPGVPGTFPCSEQQQGQRQAQVKPLLVLPGDRSQPYLCLSVTDEQQCRGAQLAGAPVQGPQAEAIPCGAVQQAPGLLPQPGGQVEAQLGQSGLRGAGRQLPAAPCCVQSPGLGSSPCLSPGPASPPLPAHMQRESRAASAPSHLLPSRDEPHHLHPQHPPPTKQSYPVASSLIHTCAQKVFPTALPTPAMLPRQLPEHLFPRGPSEHPPSLPASSRGLPKHPHPEPPCRRPENKLREEQTRQLAQDEPHLDLLVGCGASHLQGCHPKAPLTESMGSCRSWPIHVCSPIDLCRKPCRGMVMEALCWNPRGASAWHPFSGSASPAGCLCSLGIERMSPTSLMLDQFLACEGPSPPQSPFPAGCCLACSAPACMAPLGLWMLLGPPPNPAAPRCPALCSLWAGPRPGQAGGGWR